MLFEWQGNKATQEEKGIKYSVIYQMLALGDRKTGLEFLPINCVVMSSTTVLDLWQTSQVSPSQIRIGFMKQGPINVI